MRWRNWKVIRQAPGQALELYHLRTDPGEAQNTASVHPEVVATMEAYLKEAPTESEDWPVNLTLIR